MATFLILVCIGLLAGMLGGFLGTGGGIITVPALVFFVGMSQHEAQGTSLAFMLLPIGILAAYNYHKNGNMNIKFAVIIGVAYVIGGFFGSKIALSLRGDIIRKFFSSIVFLISLRYIFSKKAIPKD